MDTPDSVAGQKGFAFTPQFIHPAWSMALVWTPVFTELSKGSILVLLHLIGRKASGKRSCSRGDISRLVGLAKSTVSVSVADLLARGLVEEGPSGLALVLHESVRGSENRTVIRERSSHKPLPSCTPKAPGCQGPRRPAGTQRNQNASQKAKPMVVQACQQAGLEVDWAFRAARKTHHHPERIRKIGEQVRLVLRHCKEPIREPEKFLYWALTKGGRTVASRAKRIEAELAKRLRENEPPERVFKQEDLPALLKNYQLLKDTTRRMSTDSPGYLEHHDQVAAALSRVVLVAEPILGDRASQMKADLRNRLQATGLEEESALWKRAWTHHWSRAVCRETGLGLSL